MNELMNFEGHNVEVFEWNGQVLFNPKHVAECLELTEEARKKQLQRMNNNQKVKLKNSDVTNCPLRKLNNAGEYFITESGVYKMIFASRTETAEKFQDWVTDEVLPSIRKTGGYIETDENMSDEEIMAKALMVAQNTINKKNELLKAKEKELTDTKADLDTKNKFINQIAVSENSLLVREVAKIASKNNISIGEKRLWNKLREWGIIFKNSTEPKQSAIDNGYVEVVEGSRQSGNKVFTYHTTRITGKGQKYIINKLLKDNGILPMIERSN